MSVRYSMARTAVIPERAHLLVPRRVFMLLVSNSARRGLSSCHVRFERKTTYRTVEVCPFDTNTNLNRARRGGLLFEHGGSFVWIGRSEGGSAHIFEKWLWPCGS